MENKERGRKRYNLTMILMLLGRISSREDAKGTKFCERKSIFRETGTWKNIKLQGNLYTPIFCFQKFAAGDESHYETCCICLDDYVVGDKLRILPCDHAYHMKCIDPWLLKNKRVCPQCRLVRSEHWSSVADPDNFARDPDPVFKSKIQAGLGS